MLVKEIMTPNPFCCTADTSLEEVAKAMVEHDCGEIPIVQSRSDRTLLGVVTDRDIVCRLVAIGRNPVDEPAESCMSTPSHRGTREHADRGLHADHGRKSDPTRASR